MSDRLQRFFSPGAALLGVGLLVAGLLFGAYCVSLVVNERRISIKGFLLAGALILGGVAALVQMFPRGCRACRKRLTLHRAAFPAEHGAWVHRQIEDGDARSIHGLAALPLPAADGQRAALSAEICTSCSRVGVVTVAAERWTGRDWSVLQQTAPALLFDDRAQALAAALAQRGPSA
jgi:hypothetical protein